MKAFYWLGEEGCVSDVRENPNSALQLGDSCERILMQGIPVERDTDWLVNVLDTAKVFRIFLAELSLALPFLP